MFPIILMLTRGSSTRRSRGEIPQRLHGVKDRGELFLQVETGDDFFEPFLGLQHLEYDDDNHQAKPLGEEERGETNRQKGGL